MWLLVSQGLHNPDDMGGLEELLIGWPSNLKIVANPVGDFEILSAVATGQLGRNAIHVKTGQRSVSIKKGQIFLVKDSQQFLVLLSDPTADPKNPRGFDEETYYSVLSAAMGSSTSTIKEGDVTALPWRLDDNSLRSQNDIWAHFRPFLRHHDQAGEEALRDLYFTDALEEKLKQADDVR